MLSNYIKIALRNFRRNKVFVLINVFGLGLALACCIIAYLNWDYNESFDTQHEKADEIYRVNFVRITNGRPIKNGSAPFPIREAIRNSVGQVDQSTRYYPTGGNFRFAESLFRTSITGVDLEFFDMFSFEVQSGSLQSISDKRTMVVSSEFVEKHFPTSSNPVGETLIYMNGDERIDFVIGGVFEQLPMNNSFYYSDAYMHYENIMNLENRDLNNWAFFNNTFVLISDPKAISSVESELSNYVTVQNEAKPDYKVDHYYLDHLPGMAVRAEREGIWNHWTGQSLPIAAAIAPGIMAFLLLLLACFNFTNTSIAIAHRRLKEIGIRKVMGSERQQIITQFLGENMALAFLALVAGVLFAAVLVPAYSAMWAFLEIEMAIWQDTRLVLFLLGLWLLTGLIAGSYPAFYVSRFDPSTILKGTTKVLGTNLLTRVLLTLQYALCLISIICAFVFMKNADYQNEYDLGFDIDNVLYAYVNDRSGYEAFRNELEAVPEIKSIAGSGSAIANSWYTDPIRIREQEMDVTIFDIGADYLATIGASVIAGRNFRKDSPLDMEESVIVNEELVKQLQWTEPLDQVIILADTITLKVVGVVEDIFYDGALWEPLEPMLMRYVPEDKFRFLTVSTGAANVAKMKTLMDEKYEIIFPDQLSTVRPLDQERAESVEVNVNIRKLFLCLGIVALLLSVIGLFSLVSLNINRRMKEMGIRKVLGASIQHITFKIGKEFLIIFLVASIIGSVAGYYLAAMLMGSIWTYYVEIGPVIALISILILFLVSLITVGGKIFRAATVVPAEILSEE
ncbi:MAG: ABC transporter permease [Saprospiraceae bacterium]|nr:ABC transporter permease [Saprospiraceae bacterium]